MLSEVEESIIKNIAEDLNIPIDRVRNNVLMYFEEIANIMQNHEADIIKMNYLGKFWWNVDTRTTKE